MKKLYRIISYTLPLAAVYFILTHSLVFAYKPYRPHTKLERQQHLHSGHRSESTKIMSYIINKTTAGKKCRGLTYCDARGKRLFRATELVCFRCIVKPTCRDIKITGRANVSQISVENVKMAMKNNWDIINDCGIVRLSQFRH